MTKKDLTKLQRELLDAADRAGRRWFHDYFRLNNLRRSGVDKLNTKRRTPNWQLQRACNALVSRGLFETEAMQTRADTFIIFFGTSYKITLEGRAVNRGG